MLDLGLDGTVAMVTGAGRGIGQGIALELARRGSHVVACARSIPELEKTRSQGAGLPGSITVAGLDVTDAQAVAEVVGKTEAELGPIRLLVNNAGSCGALGRFSEVGFSTWWRDIEVNLGGAVACSHAVVPGMRAAGGGRIVNVISAAAFVRQPLWSAYCSSKAALHALTECLAADLEDVHIGVFSLDPGFVRTELMDRARDTGIENGLEPVVTQFETLYAAGLDKPAAHPALLAADLCAGGADERSGSVFYADEDFTAAITQSGS